MAVTDVSKRTTSGIVLPTTVSGEIWAATQEASVVQQLASRVDLPASGVTVHTITGDPTASFVLEAAEKPVSRPTVGNKPMSPFKIAVIEPFSNEFRRDLPGLYRALVNRLPGAIAKTFDNAALHGIGAPTGDFDTLAASPTQAVGGAGTVYSDLLTALGTVASATDADASGWVISPGLETILLSELDGNDRPLFAPFGGAPSGRVTGTLLGRDVIRSKRALDTTTTPDTVGIVGDWTQAYWGQVEAITIRVSDQATLNDNGTLIHLWQRNMFAVLAECEVGFRVRTDDAFVRLTLTA